MSSAYGGGGGGVNIFIDASTGGSGGLSSSEVTAIAAAETAILSTRLVAGASAPFDTLEEVEQFLTNSLVLRSGMLGDLPAGGFKVTGLGAPIDNADAARLSDVNALATLVSGKAPIASPAFTGTATATDLSLSGQLTVNAGLTSVGDLVAITVDSQIAAESATKPLTVQTHAPGSTLTVQTTGSGSELQVRATGAGSALALSSAGHNVNVTAGASAYVGAVTGATVQTTGPAADLILETTGAGSEAIVRSDAGPLVFIAETTGFMRSGADLTLQSVAAGIALNSATGVSIDAGAVTTNTNTGFGMVKTPHLEARLDTDFIVQPLVYSFIPWDQLELGDGFTFVPGDDYITILQPGIYHIGYSFTAHQGNIPPFRTSWIEFNAKSYGGSSVYGTGGGVCAGSAVVAAGWANMQFRVGIYMDTGNSNPNRIIRDGRLTATRIGAYGGQDPPQVQI